jgi:hypothetical protein
MPRKIRCSAVVVLMLSLVAGLAGQAAHAAPATVRPAVNDSSAGDLMFAFWSWLTVKLADFGQLPGVQTRPGTGMILKIGSQGNPNGPTTPPDSGSSSSSSCVTAPVIVGLPQP